MEATSSVTTKVENIIDLEKKLFQLRVQLQAKATDLSAVYTQEIGSEAYESRRSDVFPIINEIKTLEDDLRLLKEGVTDEELAETEAALKEAHGAGAIEVCLLQDLAGLAQDSSCKDVWWTGDDFTSIDGIQNRALCAMREWLIEDEDEEALRAAWFKNPMDYGKIKSIIENRRKNVNGTTWYTGKPGSSRKLTDISATAIARMFAWKRSKISSERTYNRTVAGYISTINKIMNNRDLALDTSEEAEAFPFGLDQVDDSREFSLDREWCARWASYIAHDNKQGSGGSKFCSGSPTKLTKVGIDNRRVDKAKKDIKSNWYSFSPLEYPIQPGDFLVTGGGNGSMAKVLGVNLDDFLTYDISKKSSITTPPLPKYFRQNLNDGGTGMYSHNEYVGTDEWALLSNMIELDAPDSALSQQLHNDKTTMTPPNWKSAYRDLQTWQESDGSSSLKASDFFRDFRRAWALQAWLFNHFIHQEWEYFNSHIYYCIGVKGGYIYLLSPNSTGERVRYRKMRMFHTHVKKAMGSGTLDKDSIIEGKAEAYVVPFKGRGGTLQTPAFKGEKEPTIPIAIIKPKFNVTLDMLSNDISMDFFWGAPKDSNYVMDGLWPTSGMGNSDHFHKDATKREYKVPTQHYRFPGKTQYLLKAAEYGYYYWKPSGVSKDDWRSFVLSSDNPSPYSNIAYTTLQKK